MGSGGRGAVRCAWMAGCLARAADTACGDGSDRGAGGWCFDAGIAICRTHVSRSRPWAPATWRCEPRADPVMLKRDAAFPGDEIVLAELFGFGVARAARYFNAQIEKLISASRDGGFAGDDAAGVEVNDISHPVGELRVGGDLDDGCDRVAGGSAEACSEEDEICTGSSLCGHTLDIVAGSAEQREAGRRGILREVQHIAHGSDAALACSACGLDGVGDEAVFDVSWRGVHLEA